MRRGVLTVDLDCETCGGTGRVPVRTPIDPIRYGGGKIPTRVTGERMCSCVRVEELRRPCRVSHGPDECCVDCEWGRL